MKRLILFTVAVLLLTVSLSMTLSTTLSRQKSRELMNQANELYSRQKYPRALKVYKKLESAGVYNASILYNLANAYYKTGQFAYSKYYYEKAKLFIPNDSDLRHNLKIVNQLFVDKFDDDRSYGEKFIAYLQNLLSLNFILWVYTSFIILGVFLVFIRRYYKKLSALILILYLLLVFIFIPLSYKRICYFFNPDKSLVWSDRVEIKSGPSDKLATLFVLHQGSIVTLKKTSGEWVSIDYNKKLSGWLKLRDLKTI